MAAPSAGNQQPWHFVLVDDRDILRRIPEIHPHASMVPGSAIAILVCGDSSSERYPEYWIQDCAAATENILLAARALGLGAVWLGITPRAERVAAFKDSFDLPEQIAPLSMIAIGKPAETKPPAGRYDGARIHRNHW